MQCDLIIGDGGLPMVAGWRVSGSVRAHNGGALMLLMSA